MGGEYVIQIFFNFIALCSFYILFSGGLALVFGVMRVINFAHGELFMLGAFVLWTILTLFKDTISLPVLFFIALGIAPLVVGGVGVVIERGMFRPLRDNAFGGFMASLGLSYVLQVAAMKVFGVTAKSLPSVFTGDIRIFGGVMPMHRLVVSIFSLIMMAGLWYFLMRTRVGRGVRATAQNPQAALLQGISFNRMSALTMGLGSALAAISGTLMASVSWVGPHMGIEAIWKAFIIVIVGGLGSIPGAVLASILFSFLDSMVITFGLHQYVIMIDSLIMLIVLAFRPEGLLGRE